jgi:integrase
MEMAKPKGMFLRGRTWWVRKDVPKDLVAIIGKTSLQRTLATSDQPTARVRFHVVMAEFESRIDRARKRLNNQPQSGLFTVALDPRHPNLAVYRAFEASKPENQIREMLEQANLIKPKKAGISLDEVFKQWVKERKPTDNTKAEYERAKDLFKELNSDLPIGDYTSDHARKWKQHVVDMTHNGRALAHATLEKTFGAVTTLFRFADRNDYLTANPFAKIVLEKPKRAKVNQRQEWDRDELRVLFKSPVYSDGKRFIAGGGEAAYWLPVLALYHGCRAGELCQLDKVDQIQREGIPCLRIRPSFEDNGEDKSVKTTESVRIVPLHQRVIELGFLKYVKSIKGRKMFPNIKPDSRGRWSGDYSKWFGRYRRSIGLDQRWTDFHSFRHTWKTAARGASIPEDFHDEISGHDSASVGRSYGRIPVKQLKKALDRVRFDVAIPKWSSTPRKR